MFHVLWTKNRILPVFHINFKLQNHNIFSSSSFNLNQTHVLLLCGGFFKTQLYRYSPVPSTNFSSSTDLPLVNILFIAIIYQVNHLGIKIIYTVKYLDLKIIYINSYKLVILFLNVIHIINKISLVFAQLNIHHIIKI